MTSPFGLILVMFRSTGARFVYSTSTFVMLIPEVSSAFTLTGDWKLKFGSNVLILS